MSLLPGGISGPDGIARDYSFVPATGNLELALADAAARGAPLPEGVSAVLAAALETLGGEPASRERVAKLAVGDRQFLMRCLAVYLGMDDIWLSADCAACRARFDLAVRLSTLPVKPAGPGYPYAAVETGRVRLRVRVPTGADQAAIRPDLDAGDSLGALLERCIVDSSPTGLGFQDLSAQDIEAIDAALEAIAPEVGTTAEAVCPDCGYVNLVELDPYACLWSRGGDDIYEQVHILAGYYHWSEEAILSLPPARRRRYLSLIESRRGVDGLGGTGFATLDISTGPPSLLGAARS
jgi:hypothetical protein